MATLRNTREPREGGPRLPPHEAWPGRRGTRRIRRAELPRSRKLASTCYALLHILAPPPYAGALLAMEPLVSVFDLSLVTAYFEPGLRNVRKCEVDVVSTLVSV